MFGVKQALESRGHDVHPFAARLPENEPAPDADLFVNVFGGTGKYRYQDYAARLSLPRSEVFVSG